MAALSSIKATDEFLTGVKDKCSFVSKLTMLSRATSDDDQPMPGYLFKEINSITFESNSYCNDLIGWLDNRLGQKSSFVKLKALRIMKFLVLNGYPYFRQQLRKQTQRIAEAIQHSGPPDALHGNAHYLAVRQEAKELYEVLYNIPEDDSSLLVNPPTTTTTKFTGLGSSGNRGRLEGFGNSPDTPEKSFGGMIISELRNMADKVSEMSAANSAQATMTFVPQTESKFSSYRPVNVGSGQSNDTGSTASSVRGARVDRNTTRRHKKGVAGGGWDEDTTAAPTTTTTTQQQTSSNSSQCSNNSGAAAIIDKADGLEQTRCDDWANEKNLVNSIVCTSTDEPYPTRHELKQFITTCSGINCDVVIKLLNASLDSNEYVTTMRSLLCLEAVLRTDLVHVRYVAVNCSKSLVSLYIHSGSRQVQQKARKIIRIIVKLSPDVAELFDDALPSATSKDNNIDCASFDDLCGKSKIIADRQLDDGTVVVS